ncbi:4Fe-4S ferredoxin [Clostridia bacterium]|nr:4Fe-4S ferredoxin [Clostridia bacterium]
MSLKTKVIEKAKDLGMTLVGFANVERWEDSDVSYVPREFFPHSIWDWSRTVIVMAVPMPLPILETTPSVMYSELYATSNRLLDETAYRIGLFLNNLGRRAFYFPRDCYGDLSVLVKKPEAAFSHVVAGKYAGLGTIGFNHALITPEYGPRLRLVSVITDAEIEPSPLYDKELCVGCGVCGKKCPKQAFTKREHGIIADMDKVKCAEHHVTLKGEMRAPCGICTLVCPVGEDRKMYGNNAITKTGASHVQDFGANA